MQIYVDTDTNIDSGGTLTAYVEVRSRPHCHGSATTSRGSRFISATRAADEPTAPISDA